MRLNSRARSAARSRCTRWHLSVWIWRTPSLLCVGRPGLEWFRIRAAGGEGIAIPSGRVLGEGQGYAGAPLSRRIGALRKERKIERLAHLRQCFFELFRDFLCTIVAMTGFLTGGHRSARSTRTANLKVYSQLFEYFFELLLHCHLPFSTGRWTWDHEMDTSRIFLGKLLQYAFSCRWTWERGKARHLNVFLNCCCMWPTLTGGRGSAGSARSTGWPSTASTCHLRLLVRYTQVQTSAMSGQGPNV
jgi:hypothetical protein